MSFPPTQVTTASAVVSEANPSRTSFRTSALHLLVLFNFAVSQPLFDRLTERLAYCRDLNLPAGVIYGLTIALTLVLPGLLVLAVWLCRWISLKRWPVAFRFVLFGLLCLLVMPVLKQASIFPPFFVYLGTIALAIGGVWCYGRWSGVRQLLTFCVLGVPLFPVLFLMQYTASTDARYASATRLPNWTPAPVVMIVFDEFCGSSLMTPEREIDAERFPNFAALAQDSHWFRNAASVNELTSLAVPALLSGRYPDSTFKVSISNRPQNLFSMLVGTGDYEYAAFEPVSRFAPEGIPVHDTANDLLTNRLPELLSTLARVYLFHLIPEQHGHCLPAVPKLWFGVRLESDIDPQAHRGTFRYSWSAHRDEQLAHFLRTIDGSPQPSIHFLHVLMPHVPWCFYPSGRRYTKDSLEWELENLGQEYDEWSSDELHPIHAQQRYLLQLMYVDRFIGDVLAKLRATGMYDRSLLVVTGDHGISFRPNQPRRATADGNRDEIQSVPLFIKLPGETGGVVHDHPIESVDILPTIAGALGYRLTQQVDGRSVFDRQHPPRSQRRYGLMQANLSARVEEIRHSPVPDELYARFGSGADSKALFRAGPIPELVGRRVDELPLTNAPPLTLEMSRYADVWPAGAEDAVPGFYEGRVLGFDPVSDAPVVIAVAVNGVVQAVTRTYRHAAALSQWSAIVAEDSFHPGQNDVRCYQVQGDNSDWSLTPCQLILPMDQDT